ncbi:SAM-dependent methyltransferase [Nonomuraea jabiensis]|uniref:SAM-dependent methyltransferase n=1 Tax=Nonomuraea jabiensis TaxID=882448 RepID=UPI003D71CCE2
MNALAAHPSASAAAEIRSLDPLIPNVARMANYLLGGRDNFAADRDACEDLLKAAPWMRQVACDSRAFQVRAVSHIVAELGISQFIDFGCGLPAQDNVHQIAQRGNPTARVVYVDNDAVVGVHGRALLARTATTEMVVHDVRDVDVLLNDEKLRGLISWDRPIAVVMTWVMDYIREPGPIIDALWRGLPPDSVVAFSHLAIDGLETAEAEGVVQVYDEADAKMQARSASEILALFGGTWEWQEPGFGPVQDWKPIPGAPPREETRASCVGGVAIPLGRQRQGTE